MHCIPHLIEKRWSSEECRSLLYQSRLPHEQALIEFLGLDSIFQIKTSLQLAQRNGYQLIQIPKKKGYRSISIPEPTLLQTQRMLLKKLQPLFVPYPCSHGFVPSRSPYTHAQRLVGSRYLLRIDLKNFFTSCTQFHILDAFNSMLPTLPKPLTSGICYLASYWMRELRPTVEAESLRRVFNKCAQLREPIQRFLFQHVSISGIHTLREMSLFSSGSWSLQHLGIDREAQRDIRRVHRKMWRQEPLNFDICRHVRLYYLAYLVQRARLGLSLHDPPRLKTLVSQIEDHLHPTYRNRILFADRNIPGRLRALPQGGALSPWISNLIAHRLDQSCLEYARSHGLVYSRYADDLCFGGDRLPEKIIRNIIHIIEANALRINRNKILHRGPGQQLKVTGLIINRGEELGIRLPKKYLRWLRAVVHYYRQGKDIHKPDGSPMSHAQLQGHLSYVQSIQPNAAHRLRVLLQ